MMIEKKYDAGDVTLNYAEGPDNGPPLILLHGVSGHWRYLSPIIRATENNWHTYAFDQRGHGKSGKTPEHYYLKDYASDITRFIDEKLTAPTVLFGHSLGGMVSTMVSGNHPEKVRGLIVGDSLQNIDTQASFQSANNNKALKEAFGNIYDFASRHLTEQEIARRLSGDSMMAVNRLYAKHLTSLDPETMSVWIKAFDSYDSYVKMMDGYDCERLYGDVSCPILLVQSDFSQGGILTDEDVRYISSVHSDTCLVKLPGQGHDMGLDTGSVDWTHGPLIHFLFSLL